MQFKKSKFLIEKNVVPKQICAFLHKYISKKEKVAKYLFEEKLISPFTKYFGVFNDGQVANTYSHYGDIAMETLLDELNKTIEQKTKLKLIPMYSYMRFYKKGSILYRHTDRAACDVSATLNLGGDPWPIYLEPSGKKGRAGIKVELEPGDMLLYKGSDLEHWREEFLGKECCQVFLHYNERKNKKLPDIHDDRPFTGIPNFYIKDINKSWSKK
jgi:hypothetical protein|tara:strand:+ start:3425 stop:4066 length:642 start_codon:yes stop_codon:yes gene_type:complete